MAAEYVLGEKGPLLTAAPGVSRPGSKDTTSWVSDDEVLFRAVDSGPASRGRGRAGLFKKVVLPGGVTLVLLALLLPLLSACCLSASLALAGSFRASASASSRSDGVDAAELKQILRTTPSNESVAEWLRYYTAGPHLAGQNYSQAAWTRDRWAEWGLDTTSIAAYDLYLNTPVDHSLKLLTAGKKGSELAVSFTAKLEEDVLPEDATTGLADRVPTFHGYSASGNVTGPLVFVNYGTYQDYADLERANVSLKGAVALARYGGIFRGLKVKRAQELGAVGVLIYSDPGDDGEATEANGYAPYPDGPARQPSSVQRGSVQFLSVAPGDPTTPGYPSLPGVPRGSTERYIPQIPSLPISYADALPLLRALNGHGPRARDLGSPWTSRLGLAGQGVEYSIGPTPADEAVVQLVNEQHYNITPIWNVVGVINGSTLPHEVVVVGNHRDAWIAGGAVDPNSGSAVLNEVVRSFGVALARGWRPLRTIVFASWDGEEYGLLGSTEWVEEYLPWLAGASLAYVNIDSGASGPHFSCSAVPLLYDVLYSVTADVASPNQTVPGQSVRDTWDGRIRPMGSGSDFTAFLDHAGIPSVDLGFDGSSGSQRDSKGEPEPVYHYHSNYDSYHWMAHFGDPGFVYHQTMAQILGLLTARLATDVVVPFRAADYAGMLETYVDKVRVQFEKQDDAGEGRADADADAAWAALSDEEQLTLRARPDEVVVVAETAAAAAAQKDQFRLALVRLYEAVEQLATPAAALDAKSDELRAALDDNDSDDDASSLSLVPSWWRNLLKRLRHVWLALQVLSVNHRYQYLERKFLYADGLDGREWFKHVVFAPGLWTGYAGAVFPGMVESIDTGNWTNAVRWADVIEERILDAAKALGH